MREGIEYLRRLASKRNVGTLLKKIDAEGDPLVPTEIAEKLADRIEAKISK